MRRPNLILLSIDEMIYNAMSFTGNPWVSTPNIDNLMKEGIYFQRAYTTNPVCSPARASWATGLYTSENGSNLNFCRMLDECPDIGQLMNKNGYYPAHAGKWHVEGRNVRDSFHCLYYGNDEIWAMGGEIFDCATTHAAISFLEEYQGEKPFYLQIGYINPHDICEYLHNYEFKDIPDFDKWKWKEELPSLPQNFGILPDETAVMKAFRRSEDCLIHKDIYRAVNGWSEYEWRYYIWNYYRYVEKVDAEIGKIVNVLKQSRWRENTVVLFTADHGESLAEHSMFQKFTLYEESIRVPFAVIDFSGKYVAGKGQVSDALISGVDVFGTLCDYAGIATHSDAGSVRPLVENREEKHRESVYVENNYWGRALVTEKYKLIMDYIPDRERADYMPPEAKTHQVGDVQLFDLHADPFETENLAGQKPEEVEYLLEKLREYESRLRTKRIHPSAEQLIDRCQKRVLKEYGM